MHNDADKVQFVDYNIVLGSYGCFFMSLNETITQVCNQITAQDFLTVSDFYSLKPGNIF